MPDMEGHKVYEQLKKINPHIRVLLCSGYSMEDNALNLMRQGCDGFIQKPFNLETFSRKIRDVLDKK